MTPGWPLWLGLTLGLPLLGRLAGRTRPVRAVRGRRAIAHGLHLAALASATALAAAIGAPTERHPGWDKSSALIALLGGAVWIEGMLLIGVRPAGARSERAAETRGAADPLAALRVDGDAGEAPPEAEASGEPLPREARELLERILRLERVTVEEIMTPRERIVLADSAEPLATTLHRMRASGRSRLPVAAGSPDRILGVLHAKDLVPLALHGERASTLRRQLRRYLSVPSGQTVGRLLEEFRRHRVHIGLVTDPLGATVGLVTVTDVFRFLIGPGGSRRGVARPETER